MIQILQNLQVVHLELQLIQTLEVFSSLFNEIIIVDPALYLPCKSSSDKGLRVISV